MRLTAVALALILCGQPASAQAPCRLALALGFDVSRSVDAADHAIQTDGIVAALADPGIREALLRPARPVALTLYEWGGPGQVAVVVPWTVVRGDGDLAGVIARILAHERDPRGMPTGLGSALSEGRAMLRRGPPCAARTLDISGDGRNNAGPDPARVYAREDWGDILVNGLAIGGHESDIADYYRREVARGPGAFVEVARTHRDFPPAFRRKLFRELTDPVFGALGP